MSKYSAGFRLPSCCVSSLPLHGPSGEKDLQGVHIFFFLRQPLLKERTQLLSPPLRQQQSGWKAGPLPRDKGVVDLGQNVVGRAVRSPVFLPRMSSL